MKDNKDLGTLIGFVLGLAIALLINKLTISIWAIVIGVVLGSVIGRVLGSLLKTKLRNQTIKVRCLIKNFFESYILTLEGYMKTLEYDVNSTRIVLETVA